MAQTVLTQIKRGPYTGTLIQEGNKYFAKVYIGTDEKPVKEAGPYFDQDEAEVELGTLIDTAWREKTSTSSKLVRRM